MPDAVQPLRRENFRLHGFDQLLDPLDAALASVAVRGGEPSAPLIEDAIFLPAMKVGLHRFEGALLTGAGQPIPQALAERRLSRIGDQVLGALHQPVPLAPEQVVDEDVIYLGWYFDHFGHFLLESLARTWILPRLDPTTKVVFHHERGEAPAGITRQLLELLGIPPERVLFPETQTRLRRVIVPEPLYEIATAGHRRMPEPYRRIAAALGAHDTPTTQPVYLSRRLLSSRQRPIIGEFELEEVCRENGFLVVHPEMMTLADQVRLVNRHQDIFAAAGSAAYLPLFSHAPPRLHVLTAGVPFADYFLIPHLAGITASYVNCLDGGNRQAAHYLPQLVDMRAFASYLDMVGMLKRQLRSSLAGRIEDLQPAYDEAWFYKFLRHGSRLEPLPPALAAEASLRARSSWPLSWTLARQLLKHEPDRVDSLIQQFVDLVTTESDVDRLIYYRDDIANGVGQMLRHCSSATAARLAAVLADRFLVHPDPTAEPARRAGRRSRPEVSEPRTTEQGVLSAPNTPS